jgi:Carboxypeptidase regulatory-like domain
MTQVATMQHRHAVLILVAVMALGVSPARSGGMPDEEADQLMPSKAIVGFVKDAGGNTVADAKVVVTFKAGNTDLIARSDATGHFRIPGFSKDATADSVEMVCSKSGYGQSTVLKRRPAATSAIAPIEIDCVLSKE